MAGRLPGLSFGGSVLTDLGLTFGDDFSGDFDLSALRGDLAAVERSSGVPSIGRTCDSRANLFSKSLS